ncbi:hypothetical protein RFI_13310 [Reticulomyxa filosa]|uniref:G domain-containing protein n=1 Tax=Reticulomyxa filosa TaxID=46433 RepID=X6NDM6_RETFI|nr:hypothetical protein RFI_13310 [Reticulomyxa filosa]|eukprot:ETO23859.1 hypothetical protein RFI_13310 [Reticulomyxa filosa]
MKSLLYLESKGVINEQKNRTDTEHVQLVGSTGVGKSAHISLLTGTEVKVSDGAKSCTMETSMYEGKDDRCYIDTVGVEDSRKISDKKILNETQRDLMKHKVKRLKVIWIVNANSRETSTLQKQARFIKSMHAEIWKSVILIVRDPGTNLDRTSQGAREAIKEYGGSIFVAQIPVLGYTNIDWQKDVPTFVPRLS